jgi:Adenylate and Guanylate cyclase catalytic domain
MATSLISGDTILPPNSKFCNECGAPVAGVSRSAEYKQVTVLFTDVVGSMKLAAVLDAERLREIMNELFNRAAAVVQRYQGTVDKFTGDGLMALFGAPVALEDPALRACISALEIRSVTQKFAAEVMRSDRVVLQVRVGLNSGEVVAGSIGSGPGRYTAVGMAQRMEAAAPAGGVCCCRCPRRGWWQTPPGWARSKMLRSKAATCRCLRDVCSRWSRAGWWWAATKVRWWAAMPTWVACTRFSIQVAVNRWEWWVRRGWARVG